MDIKQLKYFVTIVNEGNISKAAKKLYMSQPPLTNQIKNLEEELDVKLFIRGTRQISLTEAGKILYDRANKMIELTEITSGEIKDLKTGVKGTIRIGLVSSVSEYFIHKYLKEFTAIYPDISFSIIENNTYDLLEKIANRHLELAIVRTPFDTNKKVVKLKKERLVAVSFIDEFTAVESISINTLVAKKLAIYRRWYPIIQNKLKEINLNLEVQFLNDDAKTTLCLAQNKLAVAIVPESIVKANHIAKDNYTYIDELSFETEIALVYDEEGYLANSTRKLIDYIIKK